MHTHTAHKQKQKTFVFFFRSFGYRQMDFFVRLAKTFLFRLKSIFFSFPVQPSMVRYVFSPIEIYNKMK